jgi:hypothetical protein
MDIPGYDMNPFPFVLGDIWKDSKSDYWQIVSIEARVTYSKYLGGKYKHILDLNQVYEALTYYVHTVGSRASEEEIQAL